RGHRRNGSGSVLVAASRSARSPTSSSWIRTRLPTPPAMTSRWARRSASTTWSWEARRCSPVGNWWMPAPAAGCDVRPDRFARARGDGMSQSVKRAAGILDSIAAQPKSVAQLAEEFGLHRSTMFRELQTLEEVGFARRRKDGTYAPAFRLAVLGAASLESLDLREAAYTAVRRLHRVVGNTVHVAALVEDEIVYVDKVEDAGRVRLYSRVGSPV